MPAEWAVAGGTAFLALATFALALSASRQAKIAAEHVVAIQRPLVTPFMTEPWTQGAPTGSRIGLKNDGLGPAYNVEGGLYWTGGAGGTSRIRRMTLGPGEQAETRVVGEGININWGASKGFLRYRDSAGEEWQTHFLLNAHEDAGFEVEVVEVGTTKELASPPTAPKAAPQRQPNGGTHEGPCHPRRAPRVRGMRR